MFLNSIHGKQPCQSCHGGRNNGEFKNMAQAHEGLVADPSAAGKCDGCHPAKAAANATSLHTNLWGERHAIESRAHIALTGSPQEAGFNEKCNTYHTTCGQCHVARPNSVGGGFPKIGSYSSHRFWRTPDMTEQCTACHGSRVGTDYLGEVEGNLPDVHRSKGMRCEHCHTMEEIHGDGRQPGDHYEHRYQVASMPRCENCHVPADNEYHRAHVGVPGQTLQCQVCHSQPYKTCTNCHSLQGDYEINPSQVQFKIAHNPSPYRTGYDYSVVRHVPVDAGTYADWGLTLPGYTDQPTWVYASPHNVQRWTPQTTVQPGHYCYESCHNTPDGPHGYFLRESDLMKSDGVTPLPDHDANIGIVIQGPAIVGNR
jgi:hypothetical protein